MHIALHEFDIADNVEVYGVKLPYVRGKLAF
jgi:hypothetical protein